MRIGNQGPVEFYLFLFFYKADFIENQHTRRLIKTIYRAAYKIYIQSITTILLLIKRNDY